MTAGATEPVVQSERENGGEYGDDASRWPARPLCVITVDGAYGARLARDGESWYPERWTLDGPEPYAVPLPGPQPEEPGTEVLPLADGRVLIHRVADGRHAFSLLYPTGPGTGELPLGAVECPDAGTRMRLLPPAPDGERAYALAVGRGSTAVWLVAGGAFGPEHLAEVPGHCSGGVWLDGTGRLLALDRFQNGSTKTVVVDLERGGEVSPLLQIAEHSNDRLLLADADSGLLLIRSDAPSPGRERLGWGVLGSTLPVRFPDCLSATGCSITPFAIQPGQVLTPESCAVALRIDGPGGTWVGVWRPSERRIHHRQAPEGWLPGTGLWTTEGVLQLPYATGVVPCGVARLEAPDGAGEPDLGNPAPPRRPAPRPVPLQQAPLKGRSAASPDQTDPRSGQDRTPSVHLTLRTDTTRAPGTDTVLDVEAAEAARTGAGHALRHAEPLPTVTSLTARTAPAEARRADMDPGSVTAEPLPPAAAASAVGGLRISAGEPRPPEPPLWTKVADTPPPGMSLGTRIGGALPPVMGHHTEAAQPLPPFTGHHTETAQPLPPFTGHHTVAAEPLPPVARLGAHTDAGSGAGAGAGRTAPSEPLPPVAAVAAVAPVAPVVPAGSLPIEITEPPTPEPSLWTKVADTPPPGMSLGTRTRAALPVGTGLGAGNAHPEGPSVFGEFRGEVALRPLTSGPGFGAEAERASLLPAERVSLLPSERASLLPAERAPLPPAGPQAPAEKPEPVGPRTPPTHRRPLHTGPLQSAGPASGDEPAPPVVSAEAAAPAAGTERGGEGEETSPSDSRAMTAR
ncbi:hypothetical protein [Streptomyces sp. NPDC060027]|uniref:hypothetical protein n=1 Tax=Streptomyces sp. NPDC060027 TaxID=3347040 RepID=UPI003695B1C4